MGTTVLRLGAMGIGYDVGVVSAGEGSLRDIVVADCVGAMNELRLPLPRV
jgi:hypothetical protein